MASLRHIVIPSATTCSRLSRACHLKSALPLSTLIKTATASCPQNNRHFSTSQSRFGAGGGRGSSFKVWTMALVGGVAAGAGYSLYLNNAKKAQELERQDGQEPSAKDYFLDSDVVPNDLKVSREIRTPADNSGIKFKLFQFQTCPFCCKTRAFLDYFGVNYDVIEVNSVTRTQLRWSKKYKKVPILIAELEDGRSVQLMDSSAIVSSMYSFLFDRPKGGFAEVLNCYPIVKATDEKKKLEIMNRYFLMFQHRDPGKDKKAISNERKWRRWADDVLVHTLSPNVYRTPKEALQAFEWFDKAGDWDQHFSSWERYLVIYLGAFVMWIIGKRLKKRHNLKDDVRESLFDEVNFWLKEIKARGTKFMGGDKPDLSDLAVYGVLSAIEGCDAFEELKSKTKISKWYYAMKEACRQHDGSVIFNS